MEVILSNNEKSVGCKGDVFFDGGYKLRIMNFLNSAPPDPRIKRTSLAELCSLFPSSGIGDSIAYPIM